MFAKTVIDSDAFLDMPLSSQNLYFHLGMRADDDGFINNPKKIQRMIGASEDDLKILVMKNFVIPFESGVCVIKHWKIHNYLRNDRHKNTVYNDEKNMLSVKQNGAYTLNNQEFDTSCTPLGIPEVNQVVYQCETQDSIGKDSIGKDNIVKERKAASPKIAYGEFSCVLLTDEELEKLKERFKDYKAKIDTLDSYIASSGRKYKSHYATILSWENKNLELKKAEKPKESRYRDLD